MSQSIKAGPRWYAVQTQPRREALAAEHLQRQGFAPFVPHLRRAVAWRGGTQLRREALFPGYVFAQVDLGAQRWRSINGTIGVARLVSQGERPVALPEGFVETLQRAGDGTGTVVIEERLEPGERVRITGGAFDGMVGELASLGPSERAVVLLQLLSAERPVKVEAGRLRKAG